MSFTGPNRRTSITIVPPAERGGLAMAFRLDCTLTATVNLPGQVFTHPVQVGLEGITDAVYLAATEVQATGVIADIPTEYLASDTTIADAQDRAITLLDNLEMMRKWKVPLELLMSWRPPLKSVWIENITATRDGTSGNTIGVTLTFKRLRIASTVTVPMVQDSDILALANQTVELSMVPNPETFG